MYFTIHNLCIVEQAIWPCPSVGYPAPRSSLEQDFFCSNSSGGLCGMCVHLVLHSLDYGGAQTSQIAPQDHCTCLLQDAEHDTSLIVPCELSILTWVPAVIRQSRPLKNPLCVGCCCHFSYSLSSFGCPSVMIYPTFCPFFRLLRDHFTCEA